MVGLIKVPAAASIFNSICRYQNLIDQAKQHLSCACFMGNLHVTATLVSPIILQVAAVINIRFVVNYCRRRICV